MTRSDTNFDILMKLAVNKCMEDEGFPGNAEKNLDFLCELMMECSMCGCPIGTAYFIAIQAAELRERLRMYESKDGEK